MAQGPNSISSNCAKPMVGSSNPIHFSVAADSGDMDVPVIALVDLGAAKLRRPPQVGIRRWFVVLQQRRPRTSSSTKVTQRLGLM